MAELTVKALNDWFKNDWAKRDDTEGYYPTYLGEKPWRHEGEWDGEESPFGPIKQVHSEGGGEGGAEHMEVTIQIGDRYFTHYGTWVSWDGAYWNEYGEEWFESEPFTFTETRYRKKK